MQIQALVRNSRGRNSVHLTTGEQSQSIEIAPRASGFGSITGGGELLFLALAICYRYDLYRGADRRALVVEKVEGQFGCEGEPARDIRYRARVVAHASQVQIREVIKLTDTRAEIHNTLQAMTPVRLDKVEALPA